MLLKNLFCSSIGKKYIMGITGLIWSGFVFTHMAGNLLIFVGEEAYNKYGHAIISNPAIYAAEALLVLSILLHAWTGISLAIENKKARPQGYAVSPNCQKSASLASRTMAQSGTLILVFLILHIITFKYGPIYMTNYNGLEIRDLHRLIIEVFQSTGYVLWYVVCLILLGFHLSHGLSSLFQSLGFNHPRYTPAIRCIGVVYGVVVSVGFLSQPIYVYFLR